MGKAGTRVPSVWYTKRTPLLKSGRSSTHIRVSNLRGSTAVDHHGKTIDVDTKTTMEEHPYGELFLKKSMAPVRTKVRCSHAKPQLTLKSPKNATKTTRTTRTTKAARAARASKSSKSGKSSKNSKNNNTQERAKSIFWVTIRKSGGF